MIIAFSTPLTYQELLEQNLYLKTVNMSQTEYIRQLERDYVNAVESHLQLAKEVDILTQEVFDSPKITRFEHAV